MHPIRRYCDEHPSPVRVGKSMNQREFAELVGLSQAFISQLISGRDRCGRNAGMVICDKTSGGIGLEELLTWEAAA